MYHRNPDIIIQEQQRLIDTQAETLALRDQFITTLEEQNKTLLAMCRAYESTIDLVMSYAAAYHLSELRRLVKEALRQGRVMSS